MYKPIMSCSIQNLDLRILIILCIISIDINFLVIDGVKIEN